MPDDYRYPHSILSLYVKLIDLRKRTPELVFGDYTPEQAEGNILAYRRSYDGQALLIVLNFSDEAVEVPLEADAQVLFSTQLDRGGEAVSGVLELRGNEGVIVRLR